MKDLKTDHNRILIIGIGNSGRSDDGLGWKFVETLQHLKYNFLDYEYRYQLQIEDTVLISRYDTVIFVDASHATLKNGFEIKTCAPANHYFYSSHMQSPETILYLANDLYHKYPETYTLAISGNYWDLKTSLSKEAEKNLKSALAFFIKDFVPMIQLKLQLININ
ncbi:MAG: hydrogenase maturation protease [Bacteroidia bacterium]|nr:hydrogenase maturation protease [Bacteroidia bacterium]